MRKFVKNTIQHVAEISDLPTRELKQAALDKVPAHQRADVEKWLGFMVNKKGYTRKGWIKQENKS